MSQGDLEYMNLDNDIQFLTGVGPKYAAKLKRLGIETIRDLLFYYPWRYDDFSHPRQISSLRIGDDAIIKTKILSIKKSYTRRRFLTLIEAELVDDSGQIKAVWFNQPFLLNILRQGDIWLFAGKVNWDFAGKKKTLTVSQYEKEPVILPVYSETAGVTSKYLRKLIKPILTNYSHTSKVWEEGIEEYLPENLLKAEKLIGLTEALQKIHFPASLTNIEFAKKRLTFDELFFLSLRMLSNKAALSKTHAIALTFDKKILQKFVAKLPFKLTNAQRRAAWEIICDLGKTRPMNRLLEGDVGSGKTVVAAMAVLVTQRAGHQSVWLAPTEILANQHFKNVSKLLKPFKIGTGLWTSANKKSNLEKDDLIIGTHALIQKSIKFRKLALIIVDEQHRFGVKQRAYLKKGTVPSKGTVPDVATNIVPHFLSMTATPIPRTLALALYGDLDLSIIDELPKERKKIITKIIAPQNRNSAYEFIKKQVALGRQAFVICPLIEPKDNLKINLFDSDRKSVVEEYEKLSKNIFPDLKIGLIHGKMKSKEKDAIMDKFKKNKINILISTAVIEVGIDIPNTSVMMIESAERFGLAQLHQFRGRVGRSEHQSYCFLFSESWSEITKKRLHAMAGCHSGFELAEIDLKLRGPGDAAGIRQSGLPDLKMASLRDTIMIEKARKAAEKIITNGLGKYPKLTKKLNEIENTKHLE